MGADAELTLRQQQSEFDYKLDTALDLIWGLFNGMDEDIMDELIDLARARHEEGFDQYGSTMYNWTPEERRQNVLEELADAVVYLTSGPVEVMLAP